MRDEDEIQKTADKASDGIADINTRPVVEEASYRREYLRGVLDALDWVLDEDMDEAPI